jgi:hypothetical protein
MNPAKPGQQLAMIPAVYSGPVDQLSHLQPFVDSANRTNQRQGCTLPLGTAGVTGFFDGCPVWIVVGWLANDDTEGKTTYVGMLRVSRASCRLGS